MPSALRLKNDNGVEGNDQLYSPFSVLFYVNMRVWYLAMKELGAHVIGLADQIGNPYVRNAMT